MDAMPLHFDLPQEEECATLALSSGASYWVSFSVFIKTLTLRSQLQQPNNRRRLLLKSPIHTVRVPLLRKLVPKATFIYLHRQVNEYLFWQFERMYDTYYAASRDPSTGALAKDILEVAYAGLATSTVHSLKQIYAQAGITWTDKVEAKFEAQVAVLAGYKVNDFVELAPRLRQVIQARAAGYFKTFMYKHPIYYIPIPVFCVDNLSFLNPPRKECPLEKG
ncbi:hypothetical protein SDRG_16737 [Saprolegnia diclina VS20]|uniref:Uncharacterized protein n=1 Tax=Saprolegnia diclina (strain VS20) TaxID=1156394 RepID=T0PWK9_SAPDV|nr:hypothetical protein SDRG_16737 [Saprolegnia diclina VS20]EQC25410.1 hypothetical protein SDRG_16737 [Saprolegnia diclina VS20]|eukprot:XP_008621177.1 hypothetical protein SDRG_16737 [Saprolegnia diclina VS20]